MAKLFFRISLANLNFFNIKMCRSNNFILLLVINNFKFKFKKTNKIPKMPKYTLIYQQTRCTLDATDILFVRLLVSIEIEKKKPQKRQYGKIRGWLFQCRLSSSKSLYQNFRKIIRDVRRTWNVKLSATIFGSGNAKKFELSFNILYMTQKWNFLFVSLYYQLVYTLRWILAISRPCPNEPIQFY